MAEFYNERKASMEEEEFQEDEIWAVMKERESSNLKLKIGKDSSSPPPSACRLSGLSRVIPRANNGCSFDPRVKVVTQHQSSAPSKIPDWSKVYPRKKSEIPNKKNSRDDDAWVADDHNHHFAASAKCEDDDEDDDDDEMIAPHEFIARRVARNPIVSSSMCEGIGRTLKGRDLSTVRNAILSKTGFLE